MRRYATRAEENDNKDVAWVSRIGLSGVQQVGIMDKWRFFVLHNMLSQWNITDSPLFVPTTMLL